MKVLLDSCVWGGVSITLEKAGHGVACVSNWPKDPGDDKVLEYAHENDRILITLDKDFGELAIVYERPHSGIIWLVNLSSEKQAYICLEVLERYGDELLSGGIVTAETGRIRIRPSLVI